MKAESGWLGLVGMVQKRVNKGKGGHLRSMTGEKGLLWMGALSLLGSFAFPSLSPNNTDRTSENRKTPFFGHGARRDLTTMTITANIGEYVLFGG